MKNLREHPIVAGLLEMVRHIPEELRAPVATVTATGLLLAVLAAPAIGDALTEPPSPRLDAVIGSAASAADPGVGTAVKAAEKAVAQTAVADAQPAGGSAATAAQPKGAPSTEAIGFYVNWDDSSYQSLAANIDKLTILMPEWYQVNSNGFVVPTDPDGQRRAAQLIMSKRRDLRVMPIVNNFGGGQDPRRLAALISNPQLRRRVAQSIVSTMKTQGFAGVNIDFEGLTAADRGNLVAFMRTLYPMARAAGLEVSQDVLASSATYDYKALAASSDYLVPMMYDEHWKSSPSGPISSQGWYDKTLRAFMAQVPANKTVVAIGTYSYDWGPGRGKSMTYPKAVGTARGANQPIKFDPTSLNATYWYQSGAVRHRVWMLDAASAFNQVKSASKLKPRGYAVWRLGGEDPGLWKVLANRDKLDGNVAKSLANPKRSVTYDPTRQLIVDERVNP